MKADIDSLTARECETLGLLARGHEAKSIASALGISVHTVNERLRAARRKLGVSSSREAARLLLAEEAGTPGPDNIAYKNIGVAPAERAEAYSWPAHSRASGARRPLIWVTIGATMFVAVIAMFVATQVGGPQPVSTSHGPRAAEPVHPVTWLFAEKDYPAEARAHRAQGTTGYRLQIGDDGRVEKCDIESPSGNAALDRATCEVITRRSRFVPAVDASGRVVRSAYNGTIHWTL